MKTVFLKLALAAANARSSRLDDGEVSCCESDGVTGESACFGARLQGTTSQISQVL